MLHMSFYWIILFFPLYYNSSGRGHMCDSKFDHSFVLGEEVL